MHRHCTDTLQPLCSHCIDIAQTLHRHCTDFAQPLHRHCTDTAQALYRHCTTIVQTRVNTEVKHTKNNILGQHCTVLRPSLQCNTNLFHPVSRSVFLWIRRVKRGQRDTTPTDWWPNTPVVSFKHPLPIRRKPPKHSKNCISWLYSISPT